MIFKISVEYSNLEPKLAPPSNIRSAKPVINSKETYTFLFKTH